MSAQDNLSKQQFFEVHRGLSDTRPWEVSKEGLGMHWSTDSSVAEHFSINRETPGVVIHAKVSKSSVETNPQTLEENDVNPDYSENEVPVKSGKKVIVTGMTSVAAVPGGRNRKRTYTPPRKMQA